MGAAVGAGMVTVIASPTALLDTAVTVALVISAELTPLAAATSAMMVARHDELHEAEVLSTITLTAALYTSVESSPSATSRTTSYVIVMLLDNRRPPLLLEADSRRRLASSTCTFVMSASLTPSTRAVASMKTALLSSFAVNAAAVMPVMGCETMKAIASVVSCPADVGYSVGTGVGTGVGYSVGTGVGTGVAVGTAEGVSLG